MKLGGEYLFKMFSLFCFDQALTGGIIFKIKVITFHKLLVL